MKELKSETKAKAGQTHTKARSDFQKSARYEVQETGYLTPEFQPPQRFALLLSKLSHPANTSQRASVANQLQQAYGNSYVQKVVSAAKAVNPYCRELCGQAGPSLTPALESNPNRPHSCDSCPFHSHAPSKLAPPHPPSDGPIQMKSQTLLEIGYQGEEGVGRKILHRKGSGRPLEPEVKQFMGPRFGYDFSNVRFHADSFAAKTAQDLGAEAFTIGRDVFFGAGKYNPRSIEGKKLIAHELTHVLQQESGSKMLKKPVTSSHDAQKYETEADRISEILNSVPQVRQQVRVRQHLGSLQMKGNPACDDFCDENSSTNRTLTAHFNIDEFACHDGTPVPEKYVGHVRELATNLETLRSELGDSSITINSGYRTCTYNTQIGGASRSQHLCAKAADIRVQNHTPTQVRDAIERLITGGRMGQGGLGLYATFVHYDIRGTRARW